MRDSARGLSGGAKRCTKGKSCGATCIDARELCLLELGPTVQPAMDKIRERMFSLRGKQQARDIEGWSDEKAADWLKKNQSFLEGANVKLSGGKDMMWVLGNEPGFTRRDIAANYPLLADRLLREGKISPNKIDEDLTKVIQKEPALAVRYTRNTLESAKLVNQALREKRDLMVDLDRNSPIWKLIEGGDVPFGFNVDEQKGQTRYSKASFLAKAFKLADALGVKNIMGTNMSLLHSSNEKVWPYGEVFKRAGKDPGPFESRNSWLKHLATGSRGAALANQILEQKPGKVYLSGANGLGVFNALRDQTNGKVMQLNMPWVSDKGREMTSKFLVLQTGNSNVVFGPHFTAQVPSAVIDMRLRLLKGEKPEGAVFAQPETPKARKGGIAKVAQKARKEMVAAPKAATPKVDPAAARKQLNGYVQTLRNQGQSVAQIKEHLRKMGIPAKLITEIV